LKNSKQTYKTRKFIILVLLVIVGRLYDATTTYLYTPDLTNETNVLVKLFGAGWTSFAIIQTILIVIIIYLLYFYLFKFKPVTPPEKNLNIKQFASYLFFNDTISFHKIFYKTPKNKKTLFASIGYIVSMTLISISFVVGTSTTFLIISDNYRKIYKQGIPYVLYGLIVGLIVYFTIKFFKIEFSKYKQPDNELDG
jgi:magnesium-transporting ATPase (P-type)